MRRIYLYRYGSSAMSIMTVMLIFIFLGSCSDSVVEKVPVISDGFENPAFSVNEGVATYTSLGSDLKILWQRGDLIGIFCNDTDPVTVNGRAVLHEA
ncbi:MAG: hypothetical protein LBC19_14605, partial [Tannerella sp.]|nr:hypothetical protein [Tannerella sp.]